MCGIIGYTGAKSAKNVLLHGLSALEYRGYDSAGIALTEPGGEVRCVKSTGRVAALAEKAGTIPDSSCGIGHTRWATHGAPTESNAHPHASHTLTLVHNGILDNFAQTKRQLLGEGYTFASETDTECIAHLIDREYRRLGKPEAAIYEACEQMRGSYALAILFHDIPDVIYAVRHDSPLVLAVGDGECFIASDAPAVLDYTRSMLRPPQGQVCRIEHGGIYYIDRDGNAERRQPETFSASIGTVGTDGYDSYMEKEINEQPNAIRRCAGARLGADGLPDFSADGIPDTVWCEPDGIEIVACGSATHAALLGRFWIEELAGIPVTVNTASEYRYRPPAMNGHTLVIPISQSGETADTLAALRLAKKNGKRTLAIVNAVGSTAAVEADYVLYQCAGPEIAVATTKGYTTQAVLLAMTAIKLGVLRGRLGTERGRALASALVSDLPHAIESILSRDSELSEIARLLRDQGDAYFIGRGPDFPACTECSLKLKEISYIHSEAYAAGELKHGTLSLIERGTILAALATDPLYHAKTAGNIAEVRARGGYTVLFCTPDFENASDTADTVFTLPPLPPELACISAVTAVQLIALRTAQLRGCDVDHPRNLAKSVTVE